MVRRGPTHANARAVRQCGCLAARSGDTSHLGHGVLKLLTCYKIPGFSSSRHQHCHMPLMPTAPHSPLAAE